MTKDDAIALASKINENYYLLIKNAIFKHLGICANFRACEVVIGVTKNYGVCFFTKDDGLNLTDELTSTLLLRHIFKSGYLYGEVTQFDNGKIQVRIGIQYKHPQGGSNGLSDILYIVIDEETKQIENVK